MTPEVQAAVKEIAEAYTGCRLDTVEDNEGGALVTVHDVPIEDSRQEIFLLPFASPF